MVGIGWNVRAKASCTETSNQRTFASKTAPQQLCRTAFSQLWVVDRTGHSGPFVHRPHSRDSIIRQLLDFGGAKVADETPKAQRWVLTLFSDAFYSTWVLPCVQAHSITGTLLYAAPEAECAVLLYQTF